MGSYYEFNIKINISDEGEYEERQGLLYADSYAEAANTLCEEYGPSAVDEMVLACWDTGAVLSLTRSALEDMRDNYFQQDFETEATDE